MIQEMAATAINLIMAQNKLAAIPFDGFERAHQAQMARVANIRIYFQALMAKQ